MKGAPAAGRRLGGSVGPGIQQTARILPRPSISVSRNCLLALEARLLLEGQFQAADLLGAARAALEAQR